MLTNSLSSLCLSHSCSFSSDFHLLLVPLSYRGSWFGFGSWSNLISGGASVIRFWWCFGSLIGFSMVLGGTICARWSNMWLVFLFLVFFLRLVVVTWLWVWNVMAGCYFCGYFNGLYNGGIWVVVASCSSQWLLWILWMCVLYYFNG